MVHVRVLGAGPAGCAAAIAARECGADVDIFEKTPFPRHKVCGEFLSPESRRLLEQQGVWAELERLGPAKLTRLQLAFGERTRICSLPETAWGISRYSLDRILLDRAISMGAKLLREKGEPSVETPTVIATGRRGLAPKGRRFFGFKAHFDGPGNDSMELYFLEGLAYVGFNAVEAGTTNVCGLAGEQELAREKFDVDAYLGRYAQVRQRLRGLRQRWKWLVVGPLLFGESGMPPGSSLAAGDYRSFVDPFTGSGILAALETGTAAGKAAAGCPPAPSLRLEQPLRQQRWIAGIFRNALRYEWGYWTGYILPPRLLFRITRPLFR